MSNAIDNIVLEPGDRGFVSSIPITFVLSCRESDSRWGSRDWALESLVVAGSDDAVRRERSTGHDDGAEHWIWRGMSVRFFKDAGESYWYNLKSESPRLFLVCEVVDSDDETDEAGLAFAEGDLRPALVTCSQDEAMSHIETDDQVLSWPMPPEVVINLERFVVATYEPFIKKKRRRRNWSDEGARK